jgi:hypothetical protein
MFVMRAAVALRAVFEIRDSFAHMLRAYFIGLVLVASKAGVAAGVVVGVAICTGRIVGAFKDEELGVIEGRGLPAFGAVTLATIRICDGVCLRVWGRVTGLAFRSHRRRQQLVRERFAAVELKNRTFMPDMASRAILRNQCLVESGLAA